MLSYDRIADSEGIDFNKTSESKEWNFSDQWYFLNEGFNFQSHVCIGRQDLFIISLKLYNIAILNIKIAD